MTSANTSSSYACCNCDDPFIAFGRKVLYCGDYCAQEAEYIRYHRRKIRDGHVDDPDIQEGISIIQGRLEHEGASRRRKLELRKLTDLRQLVFERDRWTCQICKANAATEIDHILDDHLVPDFDGDVNDPTNLRAVCDPCHRKKTLGTRWTPTLEQITAIDLKHREWSRRVQIEAPGRPCDDDLTWDWRAVQKARLHPGT